MAGAKRSRDTDPQGSAPTPGVDRTFPDGKDPKTPKPRRTRTKRRGGGGTDGGNTGESGLARRGEMQLLQQAIKHRWPGYESLKAEAVKVIRKNLKSKSARTALRSVDLLRQLEAQVQSDEHLEARLENSGVALVRFRETVTENPDGTRTTTKEATQKLWGHGAPVEEV